MGNDSLKDLSLAGVKWELSEFSAVAKPHPKEVSGLRFDGSDNSGNDNIDFNLQTSNLKPRPSIIPPVAPISLDDAAAHAARLAGAASDWDALCVAIENFKKHPLRAFAKRTVLPHISTAGPRVAVITDMPNSDDEESGVILSGGVGALFDKMMSAVGLSRADSAIVPLVFWRPPGGRTPTPEELAIARPFVLRAIELAAPRVILTLGTLTAAEIAGAKLPKQHGEVIQSSVPIIPIYHPNYLMLKPDAKRAVWDALQKLLQIIEKE